jgi:murein L,D-transpeptidase YcbB/YkuD
MKAALSSSAYAALVLKLVGGLMVIGSIVDCLILLVPPNFLDQAWLTTLIRDWVLRGTVPLIGLTLVLFGVWIDPPSGSKSLGNKSSSSKSSRRSAGKRKSGQKSGQPQWVTGILTLSLCYSLLFTLLIPLYFNSSRLASAAATREINEQAKQAEQQLNEQLTERREQINLLLSDSAQRQELEAQLEDSAQSPFSPEQRTELQQLLDLVQRVQETPKLLEQELTQAQQEGIQQIKTQQQQERDQMIAETRKLRIHTILTALTLAIGYGVIAWTGMSVPQKRQVRSRVQATGT